MDRLTEEPVDVEGDLHAARLRSAGRADVRRRMDAVAGPRQVGDLFEKVGEVDGRSRTRPFDGDDAGVSRRKTPAVDAAVALEVKAVDDGRCRDVEQQKHGR